MFFSSFEEESTWILKVTMNTLLAIERMIDADGSIRERFRVIERAEGVHGRAFDAVPEEPDE